MRRWPRRVGHSAPGPHPPWVRGRPRPADCPPPQGGRPVQRSSVVWWGPVPRAGPRATRTPRRRILRGRRCGCLAVSSCAVPFEVSPKTVLAVCFLTSSLQVAPLKRALSKEGGDATSEQLLWRGSRSQIKEGSWQPECWGELLVAVSWLKGQVCPPQAGEAWASGSSPEGGL